jgi:5-methylcytosine-specific restriction endonuclease McrA
LRGGQDGQCHDRRARLGYINGSVLAAKGVLGYHFAAHGSPTNSSPAGLAPVLAEFFCATYQCEPNNLVVQEGRGSNVGYIYLVIRSWEVALRARLVDSGKSRSTASGTITLDDDEVKLRLSRAVERSVADAATVRRKRSARAPKLPLKMTVTIELFARNPDVVAEALFLAQGICQQCGQPAPFARRKDGTPYLDVHHGKRLPDGGEDTVDNAIAVCPTCHREAHHGPVP